MSELREAAQAALTAYETYRDVDDIDGLDDAINALRAALAQPEAEPEPVAWQVKKGDDMSTLREAAQAAPDAEVRAQHKEFARWFLELSDKSALASEYLAWLAWKAALAHPPRNEWREAVHDELVTTWTFSAENKDDPRKALQDIINWHVRVALDPAVSSDAQALIERGKAMRDEWRLASEPPQDGRRVLIWVATESGGETFRPAYCPAGGWTSVFDGETLVAWRDVTPPTEGAR